MGIIHSVMNRDYYNRAESRIDTDTDPKIYFLNIL